jgi:hypothetical protein
MRIANLLNIIILISVVIIRRRGGAYLEKIN